LKSLPTPAFAEQSHLVREHSSIGSAASHPRFDVVRTVHAGTFGASLVARIFRACNGVMSRPVPVAERERWA
jgi:hypothetical protein